jgi:hypothetical protein
MSMLLFALCLDPLIRKITEAIAGCRSTRHKRKLAVVPYADDGTIILRSAQEIQVVQEAIRIYEKAIGVMLNHRKSKALTLGRWNNDTPVMGIEYHTELRILEILFAKTIRESATASWEHATRYIRTQAQEAYFQDLPYTKGYNMQTYTCWQRHGT